jgi:hypothetical protein
VARIACTISTMSTWTTDGEVAEVLVLCADISRLPMFSSMSSWEGSGMLLSASSPSEGSFHGLRSGEMRLGLKFEVGASGSLPFGFGKLIASLYKARAAMIKGVERNMFAVATAEFG